MKNISSQKDRQARYEMGEGKSKLRAEELIQDLNIDSERDVGIFEKRETAARLAPRAVLKK